MNCKIHREEEAKFICDKCKQPICETCAIELRGNKVCVSCIDYAVYAEKDHAQRMTAWNKFTFFIFACIPGAAHMQMGLFKRGMQLMLTFIGAIVLISYANVESFLPLAIIPTWFFSFFDAYNTRRKVVRGEAVVDEEAYNYQFLIRNKKVLGAALLLFGFIGLLNSVDSAFYRETRILGTRINEIYWAAKRAVIPAVLVLSGFMMITKLKKNETEKTETQISE